MILIPSLLWGLPALIGGCRRPGITLDAPSLTDPAPTGDTSGPHSLINRITVTDVAPTTRWMQDWEHGGGFKHGRTCVIADLDGDGRDDVFLGNPFDESYWLRNLSTPGALAFEPAGSLSDGAVVWGTSAADFDEDGDLDLMMANGGFESNAFNALMTNENVGGATVFTNETLRYHLQGIWLPSRQSFWPGASVSAIWLDYNNDGALDLYIDESVYPYALADREALDGPVGRNTLFHRTPTGQFIDVTVAAGLDHNAKTHWSTWFDFDNDGDLDLFEVAYRWGGGPNHLFINHGTSFEDRTATAMLDGSDLTYPKETFSSATADFNNDGWLDLLVFNRGQPEEGPFQDGHMLLLNVEGQGFVDAAGPAMLNNPFDPGYRDRTSNGVMGSTTEDLNLDGIADVFVGNGGPSSGWPNNLYLSVGMIEVEFDGVGTLPVPLFENASELIDFPAAEVDGAPQYPPYPYRTHAACVADLDGDGIREMLVSNGGLNQGLGRGSAEPNRLFRFEVDPQPHFVRVLLKGDGEVVNVDAIGSRIAVTVEEGGVQRTVYDLVSSHNGFGAQHGYERMIGLGQADRIVGIEVTWPGGERSQLGSAELDSNVLVTY